MNRDRDSLMLATRGHHSALEPLWAEIKNWSGGVAAEVLLAAIIKDEHLARDEDNVVALCYFLASSTGRPLRIGGLGWLQQAVITDPWYRPEIGNALVEFLNVVFRPRRFEPMSPLVTPFWLWPRVSSKSRYLPLSLCKNVLRRGIQAELLLAYRHLEIRGRAVEVRDRDVDAHLDQMAKKYLGSETFTYNNRAKCALCTRSKLNA